jgi:hypothetical protein
MINIFEGTTSITGTLEDIESEMLSGLICVIRTVRENVGEDYAVLFMTEVATLMKGYTKGMSKGFSHEECNRMAVDELSKLEKE